MKENPLTHPEEFRPHFQEFYVYTTPESDDLDEDEDQSVTEEDVHSDPDLDSDLDSDLPLALGSDSDSPRGKISFNAMPSKPLKQFLLIRCDDLLIDRLGSWMPTPEA